MTYGISLPAPFPTWCGVEAESVTTTQQPQLLFGLASEQSVAGQMFLRLDIPAAGDWPDRTLLIVPSVIRRIEPMTEDQVRQLLAKRSKSQP